MNRGELRAGPSLAVFLQELICRLREVQSSQRAWCSLGGCAVRGVINDQCTRVSDETLVQFIAQIRREKEEANGSVDVSLFKVGAESLREYIKSQT